MRMKVGVESQFGDGDNNFCRLNCPESDCNEDIVQCRHCSYNFSVDNTQDERRKYGRTEAGMIRQKTMAHLRNNKTCREARESRTEG